MGRPERPLDDAGGPVAQFAQELRELRAGAGITYRKMAAASAFSSSTLSQAAGGEQLASLPVVLSYAAVCGGEAEVWEQRWHEVSRALAAAAAADPRRDDGADPPYRGLARFEPGDRDLFFGREDLTRHLAEQVGRHRVVAVVGASGSGKSSLLRAGLIPALRQDGIGGRPPAAVRLLTPGNRPAGTHGALLEPAPGPGDTIVIIDQFEEVFTLTAGPEERAGFLDAVAGAAEGGSLRVVIGIRADFLGRLAQHPALAAALRDATVLVGPMEPAALRQVVVRPAAAAGLIVERTLTARLIKEAAREPGSLPLLSHALLETWRRRRGRALTEAMYEAAGGVDGAITTTAETVYNALPTAQAALARNILLRLVSPGDGVPDTRRPTDRAELDTIAPDAGKVVEKLLRARLLVSDDQTVNLAHDAVISAWPRYRDWIDRGRERLRHHRSLTDAAALWAALDHDPGALLRGGRLDAAVDAFPSSGTDAAGEGEGGPADSGAGELTTLERRFLAASREAREKRQRVRSRTARRMWLLTAALSVLLCLALLAAVTAVRQRTTADRARARAVAAQQVALSRQLAADSGAAARTDPDLSALLAVEAYGTRPTDEAEVALYAAAADPLRLRLHGDQAVTAEAFAPDGRTLCWSEESWQVRCADTATGTVRALPPIAVAAEQSPPSTPAAVNRALPVITGLAFGDSRTLITTDARGGAHSTDITTGRSSQLLAGGGPPKDTRLSADGRTQTVAGRPVEADVKDGVPYGDPDITVRDVRTGRIHAVVRPPIAPRTQELTAEGDWLADVGSATLAISPDGRLIATATGWTKGGENTSRIRVWDTATGGSTITIRPDAAPAVAAFSPDGRQLAVDDGAGVRLWGTADGTSTSVRAVVSQGSLPITALAFAPDGSALAAAGADGAVSLVNMDTHRGQTLRAATAEGADPGSGPLTTRLAFSADGRQLAAGDSGGDVRVFDTAASHPYASVDAGDPGAPGGPVGALADDGRLLAVTERGGGIRLTDTRTGKDAGNLPSQGPAPRALFAAPRGPWLAVLDDRPDTLTLWNLATRTHRVLALPDGVPDGAVFSPDGTRLTADLMPSRKHAPWTARTWDTSTGHAEPDPPSFPTSRPHQELVLSPDGRTLGVQASGRLHLVEGRTGRARRSIPTRDDLAVWYAARSASFAFSPDSRTIAVTRPDGYVQLLDVATGKARATLAADTLPASTVAFSPDGRSLAVGHDDGTVHVWDLATARVRTTYDDGGGQVTFLAFSPDGTVLATGGAAGRTRLWRAGSPGPAQAIAQICRAVGRDLTPDELARYLPGHPAVRTCSS
ncbi:helix-turn-helix domain-containing protein [Streptomyces sp. CA-111067]|uniref:WD40 repeat domain-containing protein n=1 Tax=Streptomyces sp. CA-111067 TaxID=3240046 RepID=UPI003D963190